MNKIASYIQILDRHPLWIKEAEDDSILNDYYSRLKKDKGQAGAAVGALTRRVLEAAGAPVTAVPLSSIGAGIGGGSVGDAGAAFLSGTGGRFLGNAADIIGSAVLPGGRMYRNQLMARDLGAGSILGELAGQDLGFANRRRKQQVAKDAKAFRKLKKLDKGPKKR